MFATVPHNSRIPAKECNDLQIFLTDSLKCDDLYTKLVLLLLVYYTTREFNDLIPPKKSPAKQKESESFYDKSILNKSFNLKILKIFNIIIKISNKYKPNFVAICRYFKANA